MQGHSPFAVARYFIEKADSTGTALTPMKLNKLVYISHGWHLALFNQPLIWDPIQAWKYGPVIESLYHSFKHCGNSKIPLAEAEALTAPEFSAPTLSLLAQVWTKYGQLSAIHLSSLTHQPGTPWEKSYDKREGTVIPNDLIQKFYKDKLLTKSGSGH